MEKFPVELKEKIFEVIHDLQLSENGEALDFGCGNGRLTEVIKQALPKWQVYGTDVSNVAIEKAKKSYPNCTFFVTGDKEFADKNLTLCLRITCLNTCTICVKFLMKCIIV